MSKILKIKSLNNLLLIPFETSDSCPNISTIVNSDKNFIGKNPILNSINNGTEKKLIGFQLDERGIPRKNYPIYEEKKNKIGVVTSGTMSPSIKKGIGLGYVNTNNSTLGTSLNVEIRNKMVKASVVKIPFVKI